MGKKGRAINTEISNATGIYRYLGRLPSSVRSFYACCNEVSVNDLIVLTGDSHAYWLNTLHNNAGQQIGYEIGTTGVTFPDDFEYCGEKMQKC